MYQVIARKYRPQSFEQLVSQDHVKQTLANAVAQGRVAHGYIFAGQRGTGKTTVARILAKSLNCEKAPSATPCQQCASCREVAAGGSMDVIEIDAASNRGIDEIRELRENVRYRPTRDRYKIFIVDEAHQITDAAFNALLKTLEEPPEWVVFVLCTTEAHKIPATITSRCQNFTFHMVDFQQVVERMSWICGEEGIAPEPDALALIALAGDGSIRDSLSTLDQAIAAYGNKFDATQVRELLGVASGEVMDELAGALIEQSPARMLELVQQLTAQGRNLQHFGRDLARFFRNLLVARVAGAETRLIAATGEERRRLERLAPQFSEEDLTRYLQLILNLYRDLHFAPQPRFHLEMGLVKMVHAGRLVAIEEALAGSAPTAPSRAARGPAPAAPATPAAPKSLSPAAPRSDFQGRLIDALRERGDQFTADAVEHSEIAVSPSEVVFEAPSDQTYSLESGMRALGELAEQLLGRRVRVRVGLTNGPVARASPPPAGPPPSDAATARALANPQVQRFLDVFGGQVRQVRDLKEKQS